MLSAVAPQVPRNVIPRAEGAVRLAPGVRQGYAPKVHLHSP
jgi:hypothetical protein